MSFARRVEQTLGGLARDGAVLGLAPAAWHRPSAFDSSTVVHATTVETPLAARAAGADPTVSLVHAWLRGARTLELDASVPDPQGTAVAAMMLVRMLEQKDALGQGSRGHGAFRFDVHVGAEPARARDLELAGVLLRMRDAGEAVERLRAKIPDGFYELRRIEYLRCVAHGVVVTAAGEPAELEAACLHLLGDLGFDLTLDRPGTEHLALVARLHAESVRRGRGFGVRLDASAGLRAALDTAIHLREAHGAALAIAAAGVAPKDLPAALLAGLAPVETAEAAALETLRGKATHLGDAILRARGHGANALAGEAWRRAWDSGADLLAAARAQENGLARYQAGLAAAALANARDLVREN